MRKIKGLEYLLELASMSQLELSDKLNTSKQNLNMWIKGKQRIPKKYLPLLEEIFQVDQEYFEKDVTQLDKFKIQEIRLLKQTNLTDFEKDKIYLEIAKQKLFENIKSTFSKDISTENDSLKAFQLIHMYKFLPEILKNEEIEIGIDKIIQILETMEHAYNIEQYHDINAPWTEDDDFEDKLYWVLREDYEGFAGTKMFQLVTKLRGHINNKSKNELEQREFEKCLFEIAYVETKREIEEQLLNAFNTKNYSMINNYNLVNKIISKIDMNTIKIQSILATILEMNNLDKLEELNLVNPNLVKELKEVLMKYD